jgi:hypothetical protein
LNRKSFKNKLNKLNKLQNNNLNKKRTSFRKFGNKPPFLSGTIPNAPLYPPLKPLGGPNLSTDIHTVNAYTKGAPLPRPYGPRD